jgi:hypothetical protein
LSHNRASVVVCRGKTRLSGAPLKVRRNATSVEPARGDPDLAAI